MSNALLSSKVVVSEESPRISSFTTLPSAVLGLVGLAERGPVGKATLVTSFEEWTNTFGSYTLWNADTVAAVEGFFEEGGQFLWFVRTARYTDINDANSLEALAATGSVSTAAATAAAPTLTGNLTETFALTDGQTLSVSLNGAAGVVSTFNAGPAEITAGTAGPYDLEVRAGEAAGNAGTYALTDGNTLTVSVDGEPDLTITFNTADFSNIALATAAEVVAVIANQHGADLLGVDNAGTLEIYNNRTIITGRTLQVTGGTDSAAFSFPGTLIQGYGAGDTLDVDVDGTTLNFTINAADYTDLNAATAAELAAAVSGQFTDLQGTDSSGSLRLFNASGNGTGKTIQVLTTGTADETVFNFAAPAQNGTGDAADADAVTVAELKTLLEADIAGILVTSASGAVRIAGLTTGSSETLQVLPVSTMDTPLGLSNLTVNGVDAATATATMTIDAKYPGSYGNSLSIEVAAASNGEAEFFDLFVAEDGVNREQFNNLTMDDASVNYIETIVNRTIANGGSAYIDLVDLDAGLGSATLDRPANGTYTLASGSDGLTNISDTDYIGSAGAKTGLRALDDAGDVTMLAIPGRATAAVQNAMLTYAEVTRSGSMFALLDPPAGLTAAEMVDYVENQALLLEASEYGAIYFPRVQVLNPNTTIFGADDGITVPPSGHIAGRMARADSARPGGVYQPAAGLYNGKLSSIIGLEILDGNEVAETYDVTKRDLLYPKRINPISEVSGGRIIDGVRTLLSTGNFPTVGERRGVIFIETTLKSNLEVARFRNNDEALRNEVTRSVEKFLNDQMLVGAFRSRVPAKAYVVDFGEGLNPPSVVFAGQMIGRIGLATQKPAEFIILKVTQNTRALEQELSQPA